MIYGFAIKVDDGLAFCSDSRTNPGVDNVGTCSRTHVRRWEAAGGSHVHPFPGPSK
jgi:putative proteasome-type protease